ncbi:hypothetical protein [Pseudomonas sp. Ant30-3]|uniref:hypothetical protein n=1 Tax=Pseudomonas sp. Ant30-3 TaxID=1488328 RepID=UPI00048AA3A8|nr:hypothetical protein [Pseudomonas sp. Ant30-3]
MGIEESSKGWRVVTVSAADIWAEVLEKHKAARQSSTREIQPGEPLPLEKNPIIDAGAVPPESSTSPAIFAEDDAEDV